MKTKRSKTDNHPTKQQARITGEYSSLGYEILLHEPGQASVVYNAGNHRQDSIIVVAATDPSALNLRQMRACCLRTAMDIAEEKNAIFAGVNRVEESKDE